MSVDVDELKRLAEAAQGERSGSRAGVEAMARFIAAANPAAVLALLERVRRLEEALDIANRYGGIDGDHHKMWVIDQMVRALTGDGYAAWVREHCEGEDGPQTYDWDTGTPP